MKFKLIVKQVLSISLSFSLGGFAGNFFTTNYYTQKIEAMEQEPRIAVPYNGIEGAYITAPASKVDSVKAELEEKQEDGPNIDRKRGGRRK
jgi:hypothetical protein